MGTITIDTITLLMALALVGVFSVIGTLVWHYKHTDALRDRLARRDSRVEHLDHMLRDTQRTQFDLADRLSETLRESREYKAELDKVMSIITEPAKEIVNNDTVPAQSDSTSSSSTYCKCFGCHCLNGMAVNSSPSHPCAGCPVPRGL